ncbi:MAG: hypothetical protein ACYTKD_07780 [Planctomycetota bacterium]
MRILLTILFGVPGLAFVLFRAIVPAWNWVASSLEALLYLRQRAQAHAVLRSLRDLPDGHALSRWYESTGFAWRSDPLGGLLDFASRPWVSVARGRGDCDDMMVIAESVLKPRYDEGRRCFVYDEDARGHALYVVRQGDSWYAASNQSFLGPYGSAAEAAECFYGPRTKWSYLH